MTNDDIQNLANCAADGIVNHVIVRDDPKFVPATVTLGVEELRQVVTKEITEWFQIASEDHTAGMPEYENYRY